MQTKRGSFTIMLEILQVCRQPSWKNRIIYKANLNCVVFERYEKWMVREGLLAREGRLWKTTEKGLAVLRRGTEIAREVSLAVPIAGI